MTEGSRKQFLTVKDVAEILDCSVGYIHNAVNHGDLPAYRDGRGRLPWRVKKKDFREWLDRREAANSRWIRESRGLSKLKCAARGVPDRDAAWLSEISKLKERERYVLTRRFGLNGSPPATLLELSEDLGITRERIRQIQNHGLRELKAAMYEGRSEEVMKLSP